MDLLENEFNLILDDIMEEIKEIGKVSFSILGSPLYKTNTLIVGNNWGGDKNSPSQKTMPLHCDILAEPTNQTYKGCIDFFQKIFDGDKLKVINFFNSIVYTNANFIRTPNESLKYKSTLEEGRKVTKKYLKRIINLVMPKQIICFGNSEESASSSVFDALIDDKVFWKYDERSIFKIADKNYGYYFEDIIGYQIFSFPHSSRFNDWGKYIDKCPPFQNLEKLLNA